MGDKIIIVSADISSKKENISKSLSDDPELAAAIDNYYETKLKPKNIEVFKKNKNIIATEAGYYLAVFKNQIYKIIEECDDE